MAGRMAMTFNKLNKIIFRLQATALQTSEETTTGCLFMKQLAAECSAAYIQNQQRLGDFLAALLLKNMNNEHSGWIFQCSLEIS